MQHSRPLFTAQIDLDREIRPDAQAFVSYPTVLMVRMSWQQRWWQQRIYQEALRQAQAAVSGVRLLRVCVADLPKTLRN